MQTEILPLSPLEIRDNLRAWVEERQPLKDDAIFINELGFYNKLENRTVDMAYRADLVLVNTRLIGFEIKSEKDNLKRWDSQKIAYTNVFDEVWLCTHCKHLDKALQSTPAHIGVVSVNRSNELELVREAVTSHGMNNIYDLSSMLWKDELIDLAMRHGIQWKSRTTKREARHILMNELTIQEVMAFVIERLQFRKNIANIDS